MALILVAHGAWTGGWAWKKMRPLLRAAGHDIVTPTYTGLGERRHLAHPSIDLATHIEDILNVLELEDLTDVVLLGHSYGGMVATGVADRASDRLASVIYLDAFVPRDGQSLFDLQPTETRLRMKGAAEASGEGWKVPPNPTPTDTAPADIAWIEARKTFQPIRTLSTPLRLGDQPLRLPRSYIYCTRKGANDAFRQFADRYRAEPGWRYDEIDASHNPHITAPEALAALLDEIVVAGPPKPAESR